MSVLYSQPGLSGAPGPTPQGEGPTDPHKGKTVELKYSRTLQTFIKVVQSNLVREGPTDPH